MDRNTCIDNSFYLFVQKFKNAHQHNFYEQNTKSIYTTGSFTIATNLPLIQERQLSLTGENMRTKYWLTA